MDIDMDVKNYQYHGNQQLIYTNNSPDTLRTVFYHLYYNAFQPGSEMDIRLQNIKDPDPRMVTNVGTRENPKFESRIASLKPDEIGYIKVNSLTQNDRNVAYITIGTILKVTLNEPILPGAKATFNMDFDGQVPVMIRRAGRNNKGGVALSMAQWYPKLAEYDFEGWHADAYIAREFYGVWGNFDVKITIDKAYTIGGSGYLQNPEEIGHGYTEKPVVIKKNVKKLTWHFIAPDVHDFTWAADPDYIHDRISTDNGVMLNFFYKNNPENIANWKKLQPKTAELLAFYNSHIGPYPYKQYSVIQGGDGGMEYAMCTLITGDRNFGSLMGTTAHEFAHSWFQFVLATNESKHEWMDEGFTSYISTVAMDSLLQKHDDGLFRQAYMGYNYLVKLGIEEPQATFADHYSYNIAYEISAYSKGEVFLAQLGYVIGEEKLAKTLQQYYLNFKFKHPTPNDFIRTAEKVSGIQLDWYLNYWTQTTTTIDYAVDSINGQEITLINKGTMPMPLDLKVTYTDGTDENFYIPLRMMLGNKATKATLLPDWPWVEPQYKFKTSKTVQSVQLDPSGRMADVDGTNNEKSI